MVAFGAAIGLVGYALLQYVGFGAWLPRRTLAASSALAYGAIWLVGSRASRQTPPLAIVWLGFIVLALAILTAVARIAEAFSSA